MQQQQSVVLVDAVPEKKKAAPSAPWWDLFRHCKAAESDDSDNESRDDGGYINNDDAMRRAGCSADLKTPLKSTIDFNSNGTTPETECTTSSCDSYFETGHDGDDASSLQSIEVGNPEEMDNTRSLLLISTPPPQHIALTWMSPPEDAAQHIQQQRRHRLQLHSISEEGEEGDDENCQRDCYYEGRRGNEDDSHDDVDTTESSYKISNNSSCNSIDDEDDGECNFIGEIEINNQCENDYRSNIDNINKKTTKKGMSTRSNTNNSNNIFISPLLSTPQRNIRQKAYSLLRRLRNSYNDFGEDESSVSLLLFNDDDDDDANRSAVVEEVAILQKEEEEECSDDDDDEEQAQLLQQQQQAILRLQEQVNSLKRQLGECTDMARNQLRDDYYLRSCSNNTSNHGKNDDDDDDARNNDDASSKEEVKNNYDHHDVDNVEQQHSLLAKRVDKVTSQLLPPPTSTLQRTLSSTSAITTIPAITTTYQQITHTTTLQGQEESHSLDMKNEMIHHHDYSYRYEETTHSLNEAILRSYLYNKEIVQELITLRKECDDLKMKLSLLLSDEKKRKEEEEVVDNALQSFKVEKTTSSTTSAGISVHEVLEASLFADDANDIDYEVTVVGADVPTTATKTETWSHNPSVFHRQQPPRLMLHEHLLSCIKLPLRLVSILFSVWILIILLRVVVLVFFVVVDVMEDDESGNSLGIY